MEHHPIESIMATTMERIRDMVDVNTVIGDPVHTADGSTVIPLSRVSFGFVAGGGEYALPEGAQEKGTQDKSQKKQPEDLPFAGGTGAGVSVQPVGFLVISGDHVRMMPAQYYAPVERVIEMIPQLVGEIKQWIREGTVEEEAKPTETMPLN